MYNQAMDIFFATINKWWMEKNEAAPSAAMLFIREFSARFPEFDDWLNKRGGDISKTGHNEDGISPK